MLQTSKFALITIFVLIIFIYILLCLLVISTPVANLLITLKIEK